MVSNVLDIDRIKLTDVVWPGAHNAGMDKQAPNYGFNPTRDWVTRCSIINTDFFDESDIVRYCWTATSMKAVYGHALHVREPA